MALVPPPTQAISKSGSRSSCSRICRARLVADDAVKIPHHHRIRMRAVGRAQNIMRGADIGHPVAHRFVDRFLQGLLAGRHRHDLRAEHLHARHIQRLPLQSTSPM